MGAYCTLHKIDISAIICWKLWNLNKYPAIKNIIHELLHGKEHKYKVFLRLRTDSVQNWLTIWSVDMLNRIPISLNGYSFQEKGQKRLRWAGYCSKGSELLIGYQSTIQQLLFEFMQTLLRNVSISWNDVHLVKKVISMFMPKY